MIELIYQNRTAMVYNVEDWEIVRTQLRIIGDLISTTQYIPVLPLRLLPEETYTLLKENLATLVEYDGLKGEPSEKTRAEMKTLEDGLLREQTQLYEVIRRKQMETMIDKIVEGKRKRGDQRSKDQIFEDELKKINTITTDNMLWPILLTTKCKEGKTEVTLNKFLEDHCPLRCKVFYDLWKKGYYITSGYKFGGDFIVYAGDPILYHAIFIIHCLSDRTQAISPQQFVTQGRLGTSVKKMCVFAALKHDEGEEGVEYISSSWLDL